MVNCITRLISSSIPYQPKLLGFAFSSSRLTPLLVSLSLINSTDRPLLLNSASLETCKLFLSPNPSVPGGGLLALSFFSSLRSFILALNQPRGPRFSAWVELSAASDSLFWTEDVGSAG